MVARLGIHGEDGHVELLAIAVEVVDVVCEKACERSDNGAVQTSSSRETTLTQENVKYALPALAPSLNRLYQTRVKVVEQSLLAASRMAAAAKQEN